MHTQVHAELRPIQSCMYRQMFPFVCCYGATRVQAAAHRKFQSLLTVIHTANRSFCCLIPKTEPAHPPMATPAAAAAAPAPGALPAAIVIATAVPADPAPPRDRRTVAAAAAAASAAAAAAVAAESAAEQRLKCLLACGASQHSTHSMRYALCASFSLGSTGHVV